MSKLTDGQSERLAQLTEEMGEALQVIGKASRFGLANTYYKDGIQHSNTTDLSQELVDTLAVIAILFNAKDATLGFNLVTAIAKKLIYSEHRATTNSATIIASEFVRHLSKSIRDLQERSSALLPLGRPMNAAPRDDTSIYVGHPAGSAVYIMNWADTFKAAWAQPSDPLGAWIHKDTNGDINFSWTEHGGFGPDRWWTEDEWNRLCLERGL